MTPENPENSAYSPAPIQAPSTPKRRPWWHYAIGGCGCLSVMSIVGLVVLILSFGSLMEDAPALLAGSPEEQARAQKAAEEFLDTVGQGDGDAAWEMMSPQFRAEQGQRKFINLLQNIMRSTKRRERTFNKIEGRLTELSPDDEDPNLGTVLQVTFLYRSKTSKPTNMCVVYLIDPNTYDEKVKSGQKFEVNLAACGERAEVEKIL